MRSAIHRDESGARKHNVVWDLRSQTRKGNSKFVRIFCEEKKNVRGVGPDSREMLPPFSRCYPCRDSGVVRLMAHAGCDYSVTTEGLVLFVKPEALLSSAGRDHHAEFRRRDVKTSHTQ